MSHLTKYKDVFCQHTVYICNGRTIEFTYRPPCHVLPPQFPKVSRIIKIQIALPKLYYFTPKFVILMQEDRRTVIQEDRSTVCHKFVIDRVQQGGFAWITCYKVLS